MVRPLFPSSTPLHRLTSHFPSGLAIFSAIVTFLFIHPLTHDGMEAEDIAFREYLEENGWDTSRMGLLSEQEIKTLEERNVERDSGTFNEKDEKSLA